MYSCSLDLAFGIRHRESLYPEGSVLSHDSESLGKHLDQLVVILKLRVPVAEPPISVRHLRVMLRKSSTSRNLTDQGIDEFRFEYKAQRDPIQESEEACRELLFTRVRELAVVRTSLQSWKMDENSAHMVVFRFFALEEVI